MTASLGKGLDIGGIATDLLAGIEEHFAASEVELPEARFVTAGNPQLVAWDCDQLVVGVAGIGYGWAADKASLSPKDASQLSAVGLRHVIFSVQLVRCIPSSGTGRTRSIPSPESLHEAGMKFVRDAGLLSQALHTAVGKLSAALKNTGLAEAGAISTLGPEGQYAAVDGSVMVTAGNLL